MATIILGTVGNIIGGPIGGAVGALIGNAIDGQIFKPSGTQGARLKDLSLQTSSYGAVVPRLYGRMRVAGTVIWATDLVEHSEEQGGGKRSPSHTTYTYSASFAVALASRPIGGVGRIWADGNLLRGEAGDLKGAGTLRVHLGHGDQPVDPLLAQAEGEARCPACRGIAYAVFEDLMLGDFGNRIPSLTFEVFADPGDVTVAAIAGNILPEATISGLDTAFGGFSVDQGSVGDALSAIAAAVPVACAGDGRTLALTGTDALAAGALPLLPEPARGEDSGTDKARPEGWSRKREPMPRARQVGLRYYDAARDYQPGLQRNVGRSEPGEVTVIELPATLDAATARALAAAAGRRTTRAAETLTYRICELDPAIAPGALVRVPVADGIWRIEQWEWQKDGVLLELSASTARAGSRATALPTDAGRANLPVDLPAPATRLDVFELPWDGTGSGTAPEVFAAVSATGPAWSGAALFLQGGDGSLVPLGTSGRRRAVTGRTSGGLAPASPLLLDRASVLDVALAGPGLALGDATLEDLAQGANRARVGNEIVQFARATPLGGNVWRLSTFLRGRGGTEAAVAGHAAGEPFALLDRALVTLDMGRAGDPGTCEVLAIGHGDSAPVRAGVGLAGATLRPLAPVHGRTDRTSDGVALTWTRRARGAWLWRDGADTPLNEESEVWEIGYGNADAPAVRWRTQTPALLLSEAQLAALPASVSAAFCVRQIGRAAASLPLTIALPA